MITWLMTKAVSISHRPRDVDPFLETPEVWDVVVARTPSVLALCPLLSAPSRNGLVSAASATRRP